MCIMFNVNFYLPIKQPNYILVKTFNKQNKYLIKKDLVLTFNI